MMKLFLVIVAGVFTVVSSKNVTNQGQSSRDDSKQLNATTTDNNQFGVASVSNVQGPSAQSLIGFYKMIQCTTNRNPFVYNNYGCYCGMGGSGTPIDATDRCCQVHDNCYDKCGKMGCWPKLSPYDFSCNAAKKTVTCNSKNSKCEACVCQCDRTCSHCYRDNNKSFPAKNYKCKG